MPTPTSSIMKTIPSPATRPLDLLGLVQQSKADSNRWKNNRDMSRSDFEAGRRAVDVCESRYSLAVADHDAAALNFKLLTGVRETLAALVDDIFRPQASTAARWKNPAQARDRIERLGKSTFDSSPFDPEDQRKAALDYATAAFRSLVKLAEDIDKNDPSGPDSPVKPNESENTTGGDQNYRNALERAVSDRTKANNSLRVAVQYSMRTVVASELLSQRIAYYQDSLRKAMEKTTEMLKTLSKRVNDLEQIMKNREKDLNDAREAFAQARLKMETARLIASVTENANAMLNQVSKMPGA